MTILSNLSNKSKKRKRVGRGPGSGMGKTSCRGQKGAGARSGYRRRYGKEGGQLPLYQKTPFRGFTRGRFEKNVYSINLGMIEKHFEEGEVVSLQILQEKKMAPRRVPGGLKILGNGVLEKKVSIEAQYISEGAQKKLEEKQISYKIIEKKI